MYCPLLLLLLGGQNKGTPRFSECLKEACVWWIAADGKCAICKIAE